MAIGLMVALGNAEEVEQIFTKVFPSHLTLQDFEEYVYDPETLQLYQP